MKRFSLALILFPAIFLAVLAAAFPRGLVSAEVCYDAQKNIIPCPKKQRPTVIYPSFTPSATFTPVPSDTPTPAPSLTATPVPISVAQDGPAAPAAPVNTSGGFTCPPYRSSVPLGAALLGLGALLIVGGSRIPAGGLPALLPRSGDSVPTVSRTGTITNPESASGGADRESTDDLEDRAPSAMQTAAVGAGLQGAIGAIMAAVRKIVWARDSGAGLLVRPVLPTREGVDVPSVTQTATPMRPDPLSTRAAAGLLRLFAILSPRDPASGLPSVNQGGNAAGAAVQGTGAGVAGAGAGVIGAGLLAGWLGLNCIGAPILLPSAAAAGVMAALAGAQIVRSGRSATTSQGNLNMEPSFSTFELVGSIQEDGEVTGSAGLYKNKDLE